MAALSCPENAGGFGFFAPGLGPLCARWPALLPQPPATSADATSTTETLGRSPTHLSYPYGAEREHRRRDTSSGCQCTSWVTLVTAWSTSLTAVRDVIAAVGALYFFIARPDKPV